MGKCTLEGRGKPGQKKLFVVDTNVLLHDHRCIYNFQENDIVIPLVAIEELDHFKKGNETINYHAREFSRELDRLSSGPLFEGGVSLGVGKGTLRVVTGKPFSEAMRASFAEDIPDHRILAIADYLRHAQQEEPVVLVSKDINLRLKAKSLGIPAEDYLTDRVENVELLDAPIPTLQLAGDELFEQLYKQSEGMPRSQAPLEAPTANQCVIFQGGQSSALAIYKEELGGYLPVEKIKCCGIEPRNTEQAFSLYVLSDDTIPLVALTGKSGTGKTLLALAAALAQEERYDQILLARPIVALSDKDIGFLPGDIDEKIGPFMQPLFDNLGIIKNSLKTTSRFAARIDEMQRTNKLVISPLAYIRGRSLANTFMIVDEAQNLTPLEIKTVITRAAAGTKMVFTGDIYQIDQPYLDLKSNGLSYLYQRMKGQSVFGHVNLEKGERSKLSELASKLL